MKMITLGSTGITVPQNAFGALPVQRVNMETAVEILRRAWTGGMRFSTRRAPTATAKKSSETHLRKYFRKNAAISTSPPKPRQKRRKPSGSSWIPR